MDSDLQNLCSIPQLPNTIRCPPEEVLSQSIHLEVYNKNLQTNCIFRAALCFCASLQEQRPGHKTGPLCITHVHCPLVVHAQVKSASSPSPTPISPSTAAPTQRHRRAPPPQLTHYLRFGGRSGGHRAMQQQRSVPQEVRRARRGLHPGFLLSTWWGVVLPASKKHWYAYMCMYIHIQIHMCTEV